MDEAQTFSFDDVMRLMRVAASICERRGCSGSEAVDAIEQAVAGAAAPSMLQPRALPEFATAWRKTRLRRNEALGAHLFRDPAWDMLLDLFSAEAEAREVYLGSLCYGSGAPPTTALRYIDALVAHGLVSRDTDERDHRRTRVRLAEGVAERLAKLLREFQACT